MSTMDIMKMIKAEIWWEDLSDDEKIDIYESHGQKWSTKIEHKNGAEGSMKKLFELKEEHIKLLRSMCVDWDDCEFGAPSIDCKRPYGNSHVYSDIAKILGINAIIVDDEETFSEEQIRLMNDIHRETETALQIILVTGDFKTGEYISDMYLDNWQLK